MKDKSMPRSKRAFSSPRLRVYGSVTELTKTQAPKTGSKVDAKTDGPNENKKS